MMIERLSLLLGDFATYDRTLCIYLAARELTSELMPIHDILYARRDDAQTNFFLLAIVSHRSLFSESRGKLTRKRAKHDM